MAARSSSHCHVRCQAALCVAAALGGLAVLVGDQDAGAFGPGGDAALFDWAGLAEVLAEFGAQLCGFQQGRLRGDRLDPVGDAAAGDPQRVAGSLHGRLLLASVPDQQLDLEGER
ncbi:hypothetical protein [Fodinicola feengrottensis]|uniref:hypothetical protein n=1 Tax=Fodinicola feengrottensis TaxID=435914 RepID=UPI0013D76E45|nr:hypothetical protein [Fodinicola feengrottensis]